MPSISGQVLIQKLRSLSKYSDYLLQIEGASDSTDVLRLQYCREFYTLCHDKAVTNSLGSQSWEYTGFVGKEQGYFSQAFENIATALFDGDYSLDNESVAGWRLAFVRANENHRNFIQFTLDNIGFHYSIERRFGFRPKEIDIFAGIDSAHSIEAEFIDLCFK